MNKTDIRKLYLQKRKELSTGDVEQLSMQLVNQFASLSFSGIKYIHIFYPITGKHEFNSLLLVQWLKNNHPEIKLVLPKTNFEDNTLSNILWTNDTPLAMNQWGITEPEYGEEILDKAIDLVIVPLLAFDLKGNRVGYGKGFYDRFLSECRDNVLKIGISYFEPEKEFEDVGRYDIALNCCITPGKVWEF